MVNISGSQAVCVWSVTRLLSLAVDQMLHRLESNEGGCELMKLPSWTLKFPFHILFTCHKTILSICFSPQPFKNGKTIFFFLTDWPWKNKRQAGFGMRAIVGGS